MKKDITLTCLLENFTANDHALNSYIDKKMGCGVHLPKFSHKKFVKGKKWHHKRCASCMYDESATATASLEGALDKMVEHGSLLTTDGWRGYVSAAHNHWHDLADSNNGENFKLLHWHIFNLKNWLRGIHHHVSGSQLQSYLHEFNYRFNRRNHGNMETWSFLDCYQ